MSKQSKEMMQEITSLDWEISRISSDPRISKTMDTDSYSAVQFGPTPTKPKVGDVWYNPKDGTMNVYYEDYDGHAWIPIGGSAKKISHE